MEISFIEYITNSYATTNPPVSRTSELMMKNEGGSITVSSYSSCNSSYVRKNYSIPFEKYKEIAEAYVNLEIEKRINTLKSAPDPFPPYCGGYTSSRITVTAGGVTVCSDRTDDSIAGFAGRIREAAEKCGTLIDEESSGENPFPGAAAPVFQPVSPPVTQPAAAVSGDEWVCGTCGSVNRAGKFCPECGSVKP